MPLNWLEPEGLYRRRRDFRVRNPKYLSAEEVDALAVPAPRVPPRRVVRKLNGFAGLPVVVLMIMLAGIAGANVLLVLLGWGVFGAPVPGALPVSLITAAVLAGFAYTLLRHWRAKDRLLRRGTLVPARITDMRRTGWQRVVGRGYRSHSRAAHTPHPSYVQDQYKVTFAWATDAGPCQATQSVWGQDGEIAERYSKDEARVTLLVDPDNSGHVLWLEVLRGMPV